MPNHGPRRVGKSFLLEGLAQAAGGRRCQAITGVAAGQLADLGRSLGERLGAGALSLDGWADALERVERLDVHRYELADPHLRFWLAIVSPARSRLQAGAAGDVWHAVGETTWPSQVLGPRWEAMARAHLARPEGTELGPVDVVGATSVADRADRVRHEVDLVAVRGGLVVAGGGAA